VATLLLVAEETAVAALLLVGKQTAVAAGTAMAAVASNGTRVTADEGDGNESNEHSETESENTLHHIPPDGNIERGVRS
jgi:TPP-dependent pyruvate/acetoin dehydrogenase alpha subunit